ncbi:MAG: GNAT family N-acetyltransferase [Pseudomonadota bacterium]
MTDPTYRFEPIGAEHEADFKAMLREPHVGEWWGEANHEWQLIEEGEASGESRGFAVFLDKAFLGYVQVWIPNWDPSYQQEEPWQAEMPEGSRGVDITLASRALGHGAKIVRAFAQKLFAEGVVRLTIDPDAHNHRAIRAYEKAGFRSFDESYKQSHSVVLMELLPEWLTQKT